MSDRELLFARRVAVLARGTGGGGILTIRRRWTRGFRVGIDHRRKTIRL